MKNEYIRIVQQLSLTFAKYHYDRYLTDNHMRRIDVSDIKKIVDAIYTHDKKNDLARFIRTHMKTHFGNSYNTYLTENIMNGIFEDDEFTKSRICTEIELYQQPV
jgi:hypothetical protein